VRAKRSWGWPLVAALVIGLVPGAVRAATVAVLYVDRGNPGCSDTGAGMADQPFCTIGAAAARVTAGQTVQVAAGSYPERVVVSSSGTASAPITFTAAPGASVTLVGQANGFYLSGRSWVTITGFSIINTSDYGIAVNNSSQITLARNHVSYSGQPISGYTKYGIRLNNVSDSLVLGNISDHNTNAGIGLVSGSTRDVVSGNQSFSNAEGYQRAAAGIHLYSAPGNTIAGNIAHDNEDSGINIYPGSTDCVVYNNVTYNNGDHGIDDSFAAGATIVSNSVYKNVTAGINVEGQSTGATLANNISIDNGIKSPRTHSDIRVESGSTDGTTMDHDLVYLTSADTLLIWNSVSYTSLAAFKAASGQETHGIQADPRWASPAGGDFHLLAGSPAIDSADSGASGQPTLDVQGNARVDDPATPNTGAGVPPYDDRGAYEFQTGPSPDAAPAARVSATPTTGTAPLAVTADASASTDTDSTPISTYTFDFGDGSGAVGPQAGATAGHTYAAAGTYTVTATVTDTAGLASTATAIVQVTAAGDAAPAAAITVTPASGPVPLAVTGDASASTDGDATPIASYRFDFGDGSAPVGPQPGTTSTHTYSVAGTYTVTVTVTDTAGFASTATASVQVTAAATDAPPSASLAVAPSSGAINLTVTADGSASTDSDATPIASYTFDFGDGSALVGPQAGAKATHEYTVVGTYTVKMTVKDTAGLASTATAQVTVVDNPPSVSLKVSSTNGTAPLVVTASASASDTDATPVASYTFDFGDGSPVVGPQTGANATHTYNIVGTYTITATVIDAAGLATTAKKQVKVRP
jgi:parallel beta-helix repeat protein